MKQSAGPYLLEFQAEPSPFRGVRYHWMISRAHKPDELVSWGYASTQEQAETAAHNEIKDLDTGLTQGGRQVSKASKVTFRRY